MKRLTRDPILWSDAPPSVLVPGPDRRPVFHRLVGAMKHTTGANTRGERIPVFSALF